MENRGDRASKILEERLKLASRKMKELEENHTEAIDIKNGIIEEEKLESFTNKNDTVSMMLEARARNFSNNIKKHAEEYSVEIDKNNDVIEQPKIIATQKIEPKKIKKRSFVSTILDPKLLATIATVAVIGIAVTPLIKERIKYENLNETEKFVYDMTIEAEIHGGRKNVIDDEFIYDLKKHEESGDCLIQGNEFAGNRIIDACVEHELSEEVTTAIYQKFDLYYHNQHDKAEKIDPLKIYQEEQEQLKEENNSYGM